MTTPDDSFDFHADDLDADDLDADEHEDVPRADGLEPDRTSASETPRDATLRGYFESHQRPPSFEGSDGHPYTVSVEIEQVGDLRAPFGAYLVFPRWSVDGRGVVGHVQTDLLQRGSSHAEVRDQVGSLSLLEVKHLLESAIRRREEEEGIR